MVFKLGSTEPGRYDVDDDDDVSSVNGESSRKKAQWRISLNMEWQKKLPPEKCNKVWKNVLLCISIRIRSVSYRRFKDMKRMKQKNDYGRREWEKEGSIKNLLQTIIYS